MYKKILVPLDGSARAEAILPHVFELAKRYHATVFILQVLEAPSLMAAPGKPDMVLYQKELERRKEDSEIYLQSKQNEFLKLGIDVQVVMGREPIVESIIKQSQHHEVDLIAMASHGHSGLAQVFYGSVAAGVLQRVDRPLLLVRSQG